MRLADVEREVGLYPYTYLDALVVGLLNGKKSQEVKQVLLNALDKHSKTVSKDES